MRRALQQQARDSRETTTMTQSPNRNWYDEVSPWTPEGLAKYYADLKKHFESIRRQRARPIT
jgi:hypothetical protein